MSELHSRAKMAYWKNIPKTKRSNHGSMMARLRWMRKSPEERQDFIKKLNSTRKNA